MVLRKFRHIVWNNIAKLHFVCIHLSSNNKKLINKMSVDKMPVGEMPVGEMSVDKMSQHRFLCAMYVFYSGKLSLMPHSHDKRKGGQFDDLWRTVHQNRTRSYSRMGLYAIDTTMKPSMREAPTLCSAVLRWPAVMELIHHEKKGEKSGKHHRSCSHNGDNVG
jgi:hypothetical protein